jgi:hypothetical protein
MDSALVSQHHDQLSLPLEGAQPARLEPFHPRSASYQLGPLPHMVDAASRSAPSIDFQGPRRLGLDELVRRFPRKRMRGRMHTEADAGVLFANILTLFVGKEHVSRKTTLGRVGV